MKRMVIVRVTRQRMEAGQFIVVSRNAGEWGFDLRNREDQLK